MDDVESDDLRKIILSQNFEKKYVHVLYNIAYIIAYIRIPKYIIV